MGFVVAGAGLEAVVQLSEELVEQVSLGLVVPVSAVSAGLIVAVGSRGCFERRECPERAGGGEAVVLDASVGDDGLLAAGTGHGCRSCESFEATCVGESCSVVSDLGEDPSAEKRSQAGERVDHGGVRVLVKMLAGSTTTWARCSKSTWTGLPATVATTPSTNTASSSPRSPWT